MAFGQRASGVSDLSEENRHQQGQRPLLFRRSVRITPSRRLGSPPGHPCKEGDWPLLDIDRASTLAQCTQPLIRVHGARQPGALPPCPPSCFSVGESGQCPSEECSLWADGGLNPAALSAASTQPRSCLGLRDPLSPSPSSKVKNFQRQRLGSRYRPFSQPSHGEQGRDNTRCFRQGGEEGPRKQQVAVAGTVPATWCNRLPIGAVLVLTFLFFFRVHLCL